MNGTLNDSDASVTGYQWTSNGSAISGATSSTYTVSEADEGKTIQVVETATDSDGGPATTSTSTATAAVSDITLAFTSAASITGTPQEGQVLTAVNGTLNDSDASVTGYQWTSNGSAISGATSSTYTVSEADEGKTIQVVETATDSDGGPATTSTSTATAAVSDITLAFTSAASITGTPQEGQVLTAVNGTLNDSDASVTGYQWTSNGSAISGATGSTYTVSEADEGKTIQVVETATDSDGGPATTSTSTATAAVSDITLAFTSAASITGTPQEGQVLTAVNGTLNDSDASVTGYQWTSNGSAISGATSSTYTVSEADEGKTIQVVETATDSDGGPATTSTSTATAAVSDITLAFTSAASITGTPQEGQVLTAVNGTLNDSDASVTGYQWTSNGSAISGATSSTYTVSEADEGKTIQVVETATDSDGGPATTSTSTATAAVSDITLAFTSAASITGTPQEGQVLTAVNGTLNDSDASVTGYQWTSNGSAISGATSSTYTVSEADEGKTIQVVETATDSDGGPATTSTSTATAAVSDITLAFTSAASITGTPQEGQVLTAVNGTLNDSDASVTGYQWTSNGSAISGATSSTYTVSEADEGKTIQVVETASDSDNGGFTTTSTSTATAAVSDITLAFTSAASITGTPQEGQVLTAVNGTLNDSDASVTGYQWTSNGSAISGATSSTYTVSEADEGKTIQVVETATDSDGGPATTSTSTATAAVSDITLAFTSAASISGTPQEGQVLTAVNGTLNDSDASVTGYQWTSNGSAISGATGSTYTVSEADEGKTIQVVETATDSDGGPATTSTSTATAAVSDITLAFTSAASITGTPQEGQVLTAVNGTLNDSDASVTGYQWTSNGSAISGATSSTYTVSEADEGKTIQVVETATDSDGGPATTSTSTATAAVSDITLAFTSAASITGTPQEGQVLTAVNGTLNDSDASVTGYQWTSNGSAISGATSSTYTVSEADEGKTIQVVETATDSDGGPATTSTSTATAAVSDITLAFTSAASITGTPQEGQVLTAVNGTLNDSDASVTGYQWTSNGSAISGATSSTYTVSEADEGKTIQVVETATDSDGGPATTSTSTATAAVSDITLAFTSAASITGTPQEGQVLTAVNGTLNDSDASVTGYQWTSNGSAISGATSSTYTVSEADEGKTIQVVETATDSDGGPATTSTSTATAAVSDITLAFTSAASITGTPQEGQVLTAVNGTLNDSDASVTGYQWTSNGSAISGATSSTYTVSEADEGKTIQVVETATDSDGGPATTSTSTATAAVSDITLAFTSAASITGTPQEGQVLTAVNGTLNDSDASVTGYQWTSNGSAISGATSSTYTVSEADEGKTIQVVETATDSDGGPATTSTSTATAAVSDITLAFTSAASITGTPQEGQVLTAVNGTLNDSDASVTGYQWTSNGSAISGATSSTYTVSEADEGKTIQVVETATDSDGGPATTSTSTATAAVSDITLAFTSAASITGTPQEGQVLTAVNGTLNDSDASVTGYQWTSNGSAISGATSSTYTVSEADEGKTIQVVETATDSDGGPATTSTSTATAAVSDITLAFTSAASITGTPQEGQVLTAVNGTLNDSDASVTGYQWTSNGSAISGATSSTYTVSEADEGKTIQVVETATDSDGGPATTSTSTATAAVSDITLAFTSAASITGTPQEGQVLTAVNGTLNDSDASVTGYQWTSNGSAISGATSSTYTVSEADEGQDDPGRRDRNRQRRRPGHDLDQHGDGGGQRHHAGLHQRGLDHRHATRGSGSDRGERHAQRQRRVGHRLSVDQQRQRHQRRHQLDLHGERGRRGQDDPGRRDRNRQRRRPGHDLDQHGDGGGQRHHAGLHQRGLDHRHATRGSGSDRGERHAQRQRRVGHRLSVDQQRQRHQRRHQLDLHGERGRRGQDDPGRRDRNRQRRRPGHDLDQHGDGGGQRHHAGLHQRGLDHRHRAAGPGSDRGERYAQRQRRRDHRLSVDQQRQRHQRRHQLDLHGERGRRGQDDPGRRDRNRQRRRPGHDLDQHGDGGGQRHHAGLHQRGLDHRHRAAGPGSDRGERHAQRQRRVGHRLSVDQQRQRHQRRHQLDLHGERGRRGQDNPGRRDRDRQRRRPGHDLDQHGDGGGQRHHAGLHQRGLDHRHRAAGPGSDRGERHAQRQRCVDHRLSVDQQRQRHQRRHQLDLHGERGRRGQDDPGRRDRDRRRRRRPDHDLDQHGDGGGDRHHAGLHHGGIDHRHRAAGPGSDRGERHAQRQRCVDHRLSVDQQRHRHQRRHQLDLYGERGRRGQDNPGRRDRDRRRRRRPDHDLDQHGDGGGDRHAHYDHDYGGKHQ